MPGFIRVSRPIEAGHSHDSAPLLDFMCALHEAVKAAEDERGVIETAQFRADIMTLDGTERVFLSVQYDRPAPHVILSLERD